MPPKPSAPEYDVAVSFADEDRPYVKRVVESLHRRGVRVFYDADHEVKLWGRDLIVYFDDIFQRRSRYVVIFISEAYVRKEWTRHELRSALARALREKREYVLPARFDATDVPGLPQTVRHMDCNKLTPSKLARAIAMKLAKPTEPSPSWEPASPVTDGRGDEIASRPPADSQSFEDAIRSADPGQVLFQEIEVKLSDTWKDLLSHLAKRFETIDSIEEDGDRESSFCCSGRPGHMTYNLVISGTVRGVRHTTRMDIVQNWLHPLALKAAGPDVGEPWDTSLWPVKDEQGDEVKIGGPPADCRDCVYSVLFAALPVPDAEAGC